MAKKSNRDSNRKPESPANNPPAPPPAPSPESPTAPSPGPGILRWLASRSVRHALAMGKHVRKLVDHQRDLLAPKAIEEVETAIRELRKAAAVTADKAALEKQMESLEKTANKWLKPYPNATYRENVEVLLVALAVAMGIRTFFLQPFKIPTGSMQPTLFGVTSDNLLGQSDFKRPTGWARICEWFEGVSYVRVEAPVDGELWAVEKPLSLAIFNIKQTLVFKDESGRPQTYTLLLPPDYGEQPLQGRARLQVHEVVDGVEHAGRFYHKGEEVVNLRISAGDHLFVDRLTYNFRPPGRGEIIVFETKGIPEERRHNPQVVLDGLPHWDIPPDQFYIKRLVALSGERVQIGDDRHLIIDGKRLDASTPHFKNVYSFEPTEPVRDSQFSGHSPLPYPGVSIEGTNAVQVSRDNLLVMGDNTASSLDSRFWGEFPATSVIGRSFLVYWPITKRFGWGQR
jgi:signal peptidase I